MDDECDRVVALELRLLDPSTRSSPAQVRGLLHPEYVEFGASGRVWTRDAVADAISSDDEVIDVIDMRADRLSPDVVLLTYRAQRPARTALRSSVWVRRDEGWCMRFHQGTPSSG
jgi:ribonuclease HI